MSSPVGFGDVIQALKTIQWIRSNCFDPICNAQVRYLEFKTEIEGLERRLQDFRDAFHQAIGHASDPKSFILDIPQRRKVLKQEADALVGNFLSTIQDCERLLKAHVKLDGRRGSLLDNAFWAASTQGQVENLRQRIRGHAEKIAIFLEPVKLRLQSETVSNTIEILEILKPRKVELPAIPPSLEDRLRDALSRNTLIRIVDPSRIPLEEGIDIMILHFLESTVQPNGSPNEEAVRRHLHFLKAHWLVETLLKSNALRQVRPGDSSLRIVKQVQQRIAEEYERDTIPICSEGELCALPSPAFDIWPQPVVVPEPSLTEPIDREKLLAKLPMGSSASNERGELYVFRVDDQNLRIVYLRGVRETERFFNLQSDKLVPFYTITTGMRTEWNMQMFYGTGAVQADYPLQSRSDAFKLQQALTGYETAAHCESTLCTATYNKSWPGRDGQHISTGEVQLWQWPVADATSISPGSPKSPQRSSTMSSVQSGSNYTKASWTFRNANPSIVSVSEADSVKTIVVAALPSSPLIMAFTQDDHNCTFWQIKLDHVEVNTSHSNDRYIGFGPKKIGETFPARMLTVSNSDLRSWNLCALFQNQPDSTFSTTFPPFISKKSKSKDLPEIKTLDCTNFALDFPSHFAKEAFELKLFPLMTRRVRQLSDAGFARGVAERESQAPKLNLHPENGSLSRRESSMSAGPRRDSAMSSGQRRNSSMCSTSSFNASGTRLFDAPTLPPLNRIPSISMDSVSVRRASVQKEFR